jgi:type I restriction enzyme S subunit
LKEAHRHRIVSGHYSSEINEWSSTTLGKIAKWSSGGTPQSGNPAYYGGDIPWCVIGDLTEGDVVDTTKQITQAGLAASSAKIVEPGTVMLAMYGASIGRTGLAAIPMATNQAIACAAPTSQVNPRYLLLLLQSQKRMFVNSGKGGAQPNISQSIIKDWAVSVPPIEEQNRLVTMSDNHQERMRLLEAQITEAQNLLTTLRRSMLNFAFTGQLTKEN